MFLQFFPVHKYWYLHFRKFLFIYHNKRIAATLYLYRKHIVPCYRFLYFRCSHSTAFGTNMVFRSAATALLRKEEVAQMPRTMAAFPRHRTLTSPLITLENVNKYNVCIVLTRNFHITRVTIKISTLFSVPIIVKVERNQKLIGNPQGTCVHWYQKKKSRY